MMVIIINHNSILIWKVSEREIVCNQILFDSLANEFLYFHQYHPYINHNNLDDDDHDDHRHILYLIYL